MPVRTKLFLNPHRPLRRQLQQTAIDVRAEHHMVVRQFTKRVQAEDLKSAAVGQNRAVPLHEGMQIPEAGHDLLPRPQGEVIRVGEDHLRPDLAELVGPDPLDGSARADRHETGGFDDAVWRVEEAGAGTGPFVNREKFKPEGVGHGGNLVRACRSSAGSRTTERY